MVCPKCGEFVGEGRKYCLSCGQKMPDLPENESPEKSDSHFDAMKKVFEELPMVGKQLLRSSEESVRYLYHARLWYYILIVIMFFSIIQLTISEEIYDNKPVLVCNLALLIISTVGECVIEGFNRHILKGMEIYSSYFVEAANARWYKESLFLFTEPILYYGFSELCTNGGAKEAADRWDSLNKLNRILWAAAVASFIICVIFMWNGFAFFRFPAVFLPLGLYAVIVVRERACFRVTLKAIEDAKKPE